MLNLGLGLGSRRGGGGVTPPAWVPTGVPGIRICLDAKSLTGLVQGDAIITWPDNSGVAGNAVASVADSAGLRYETVNDPARTAIHFDSTGYSLGFILPDALFAGLTLTNGAEVFAVVKEIATVASQGIWDLYSSDYGSHITYSDGNVYDAAFKSNRGVGFLPGNTEGGAHLFGAIGKVGQYDLRWDGVRQANASATNGIFSPKLAGPRLGASKEIGYRWNGYFYCFLVYDHALTPAERDTVQRQIADRYLLTVILSDGSTYVGA